MTAVEILQELLDSLPAGHPERPGVLRAIEVLRIDAPRNVRIVPEIRRPPDHEERMAAARARARYELGDPRWAGIIIAAYEDPARALQDLHGTIAEAPLPVTHYSPAGAVRTQCGVSLADLPISMRSPQIGSVDCPACLRQADVVRP